LLGLEIYGVRPIRSGGIEEEDVWKDYGPILGFLIGGPVIILMDDSAESGSCCNLRGVPDEDDVIWLYIFVYSTKNCGV
jgi:hypothetical protein